jgi:ABC-type uncharacterized transport system fused permease/ATPase subunit
LLISCFVFSLSSEIAFYRGEAVEQHVLQQCYNDLIKHVNYILRKKIWYTMLEQFLMRYVWGACGMTMIALRQLDIPQKACCHCR